MTFRETSSRPWYKGRIGALAFALIAALLIYPLALQAIDTGSLQQYSLIILLLICIGWMIVRVVRVTVNVGWRRSKPTGKKDHGKH
jgi:hypothetical protein